MSRDKQEVRRKMRGFEYAEKTGNIRKTCRHFGTPRSLFYFWKAKYQRDGEQDLICDKPVAKTHPATIKPEIVEKVLHLRRTYHLGPIRIVQYLERYHGIKISDASVYRICRRRGLARLPGRVGRRAVHTHCYEKQVPGHHVQVDVTFLNLTTKRGRKIRRLQYTAIDDATRIRALKVYDRHTQKNAIDFIDYVVEKFLFRIHTIRTDRGHDFQALFHWHVADKGIRHVDIKARTPQLNGKVERSHRTDKQEFYQLLTYTDDVDLNKKLAEWEKFYNYQRPRGAFRGKTPYEAMRERLR